MQPLRTVFPHLSFREGRAWLYGSVALGTLAVVISALVALVHLRQEAEMRVAVTTQNLTQSLEQTLEGVVDTIDVALLASTDEIGRQIASSKPDGQSITRFLIRQKERLPHVAFLRATNERGDVIYGPDIPSPPANNSDREFFIKLQSDPTAGLFVAKPIIGRIAQKWLWSFARRINKPDGSFGGVVFASIYINEIENMLAQIKMESGSAISIRDSELGLIARSTSQSTSAVPVGDKRLSTPFLAALKANPGEGTFTSGTTTPDGVSRTYSYRRSQKYGFTINVGITREEALSEWRKQAWVIAGLVAAFVFAALAFTWLINRAWRQKELDMAALQDSRESLHEAQKLANLGHYIYDFKTDRFTTFDILDDIFGIDSAYPRDSQHWLELMDAESRQEIQAHLRTAIEQRHDFSHEYRIIRPSDGQERWIHGKGKLQLDEQGNPLSLKGTAQDITNSKQHELSLAESESRFREIINTVSEAIFIHDAKTGRIIDVNSRMCEMYACTREEALACGPADLSTDTPPYSAIDAIKKIELARTQGPQTFEWLARARDGKVFWTEVSLRFAFIGYHERILAVVRDITERKQMEDALRDSEQRFRSFVENVNDVLFALTPSGVFSYVSPRWKESFGYELSETVGQPFIPFVHPDDVPGCLAFMQQVMETGKKQSGAEYRVMRKDGTYVWYRANASLMNDPVTGVPTLVGIGRDISESKQAQAEILRSNAQLEQFSYAISHDMRQPLRMISSYMQLLEKGLADHLDSEMRDYFGFAMNGAKRMDEMILGLLEYSRVGRKGEPPAWIESRNVLENAMTFLQPEIAAAQIDVQLEGEWPRIHVSPDEMLRLMQNLIGNALKFRVSGRKPEITVTSEIVGEEWRLCVADNGVGIRPDQIGRLFQVFQRLQSRAAYEGTGIGLALCRKIAEHHGGRIWAESEGEGQGSKFCVALPQQTAES